MRKSGDREDKKTISSLFEECIDNGKAFLRGGTAILLSIMLLSGATTSAQERTIPAEYSKLMRDREKIEALKSNLFGDDVNTSTHELEFDVVDMSVPGNSSIPVEIRRHYAIRDQDGQLGGFGEWNLEVPHLRGTFAAGKRWQVDSATPDNRCTLAGPPPSYPNFLAGTYWHGNFLHVPGSGDQELLKTTSSSPAGPTTSGSYAWMTKSLWYFQCIAATKNGYPGQGFLAISPTGDRYFFDWVIVKASRSITAGKYYAGGVPHCNGSAGGNDCDELPLERETVYFVPTRIEDKVGNWVAYDWTSNRLNKITSSDGRTISIQYDAQNRISTATSSQQTRTYTYNESGDLATVNLPDGSQWTYASEGGYGPSPLRIRFMLEPEYEIVLPTNNDCLFGGASISPFTYTIHHPSGAKGVFTVELGRHQRTHVERVCKVSTGTPGYFVYPPNYEYLSLTKKEISGPGMSTLIWNYSAEPYTAYPFCLQVGNQLCPPSRDMTIVEPDGTKRIYTIGIAAQVNEGQLLRTRTLTSSGALVRDETNTYVLNDEIASYPFPDKIGDSPQSRADWFTAEAIRPQKSGSAVQDQVTFSQTTNSFDSFARPLGVTKSSSLGYSRSETTAYSDNLSKWVLGQVKTVTCTASVPASSACDGDVMSQTDYDATTALPLKTYAFGKLKQTLTYNTDGTVATVKDGNNNVTTLSSWKRGTPQSIKHPVTPESPSGATESAVVDDNGWIQSVTDETGAKTCYGYDAMGRINLITYPSETQAGVCDTSAWASTSITFTDGNPAAYGMPAGHWRQTTLTGQGRKVTIFDALWRPVVEQSLDLGNTAGTMSEVVKRYDTQGRLVFQSYPMNTNGQANYTDTTLKGTTTSYDALDRPTTVKQDSELGVLTTTTEYLSGFQTRVTNPRGQKTTTSYMAWDQPTTDLPVAVDQPKGVRTTIPRDAYGKPLQVTRSGPDQ